MWRHDGGERETMVCEWRFIKWTPCLILSIMWPINIFEKIIYAQLYGRAEMSNKVQTKYAVVQQRATGLHNK